MSEPAAPRRRGRPRARPQHGGPDARARILASARTQFAEHGYDRASVRAIARGADVDAALVHHYFGSKEQVFGAALETAFAPARQGLASLPPVPEEELGEQITRFVLGVWEDAATREPVLALVRSAVSNETAAGLFREMVTREVLPRVSRSVPAPDRELRTELAVAQLIGTALMRHIIKVEPLASRDPEELIRRLAPVVQRHLTGG